MQASVYLATLISTKKKKKFYLLTVLGRGMNSNISSTLMVPVLPVPPLLPVGYRFNPKDEELLRYYLVMLLQGFYSHDMPIGVVNFWELEPWELPGRSRIESDEQVWYFFCKRVLYKDTKKRMFKRKTRAGHWKPTGESTIIDDLGKRSTLRFYKDSPKVEKTEWIAYEYEIKRTSTLSNPDEFVIIKLMNSSAGKRSKIKAKMSPQKSKEISSSCYDKNDSVDEVMTPSECCSYQVPADFGNQIVGNTTFSISNQSDQMASTCETMNVGSCNDRDAVHSDFEYRNTVEMRANEPSSQATSSCQNHSSVTEAPNKEEYEQWNCLFASDFENQKFPSEVDSDPPKITPCTENQQSRSCFKTVRPEDHIQNEDFNFSFLECDDLCSLIDFDVDNEINEAFPEVDVGFLAELDALHELQNRLGPATAPNNSR